METCEVAGVKFFLLFLCNTGSRGGHHRSFESSAHISSHDLQHARLNVPICEALDVPIPDLLVPNAERFRANAIEDRQEAALKRVPEHFWSWSEQPEVTGRSLVPRGLSLPVRKMTD